MYLVTSHHWKAADTIQGSAIQVCKRPKQTQRITFTTMVKYIYNLQHMRKVPEDYDQITTKGQCCKGTLLLRYNRLRVYSSQWQDQFGLISYLIFWTILRAIKHLRRVSLSCSFVTPFKQEFPCIAASWSFYIFIPQWYHMTSVQSFSESSLHSCSTF